MRYGIDRSRHGDVEQPGLRGSVFWFKNHRAISVVLGFVLLTLAKALSPISAQGESTPILTNFAAYEIDWSLDSRYVAFFNGDVSSVPQVTGTDPTTWKRYDTQTKILTDSKVWPFVPQLTVRELQAFSPNTDQGQSLMFASPDGQYLVYIGKADNQDEGTSWHLMLGNRRTLQTVDTGIFAYQPFSGTTLLNVL